MIHVATFGQLLDCGYVLACYCRGCRRWASANLADLVAHGLGDEPIAERRPRCRLCGSRGDWQVRPPKPPISTAQPGQRIGMG